ncbi:Glycosyltransferase, group 1 family protein [Leptospira kirschneri serovar Mozdok]|nr:Glycosyltransferase, group 1 family protein [Leptospira kirschneri serovar Mozdok]
MLLTKELILRSKRFVNGKRLVLIGGGQEFKKLTSKLPKNIEVLPQLKREEVLEYYKKAKAFLFPGMEDFGIAPVEAQAHCTPVIAFGKGGALETVVSDKTGVFFPEQTVESLQAAIDRSDRISWKTSEFQKNVNRFTEEKFIIEIKKQVENRIGTPRKKGYSFDSTSQAERE